ncbi:MAG: response regulator [Desulfobacterales bacterium]|jgi:DNA-binding NtrC family response regulator|nr:response regulator [Desulfobacterales bacterium]
MKPENPIDPDNEIVILLVDDEERFLRTLSRRLVERKMTVLTARSGMEALATVRQTPVSVVVLDIRMPGLDGLETLAELRELRPGLPVILLTGHASIDAATDGVRLGAYDYLLKPCDVDLLLDKIQSALKQDFSIPRGTNAEQL